MRFLLRFLKRNATYKGLLGGSRGWFTMFGIFTVFRLFGKYVGREEQFLTKESLKPGQAMTITAIAQPTRREKKSAKRAKAAAKAEARSARGRSAEKLSSTIT